MTIFRISKRHQWHIAEESDNGLGFDVFNAPCNPERIWCYREPTRRLATWRPQRDYEVADGAPSCKKCLGRKP